jgi:hypothetical protein
MFTASLGAKAFEQFEGSFDHLLLLCLAACVPRPLLLYRLIDLRQRPFSTKALSYFKAIQVSVVSGWQRVKTIAMGYAASIAASARMGTEG